MSRCQVSRYEQTAPFLLPPLIHRHGRVVHHLEDGTTPWDFPLVPLMWAPSARTGVQSLPEAAGVLGEQRVSLIAS